MAEWLAVAAICYLVFPLVVLPLATYAIYSGYICFGFHISIIVESYKVWIVFSSFPISALTPPGLLVIVNIFSAISLAFKPKPPLRTISLCFWSLVRVSS